MVILIWRHPKSRNPNSKNMWPKNAFLSTNHKAALQSTYSVIGWNRSNNQSYTYFYNLDFVYKFLFSHCKKKTEIRLHKYFRLIVHLFCSSSCLYFSWSPPALCWSWTSERCRSSIGSPLQKYSNYPLALTTTTLQSFTLEQ